MGWREPLTDRNANVRVASMRIELLLIVQLPDFVWWRLNELLSCLNWKKCRKMCVRWVFIFSVHPRNFCRNSMGKKFNQCLPSIIGANGMAEKIRKCYLLPNRIVSVAFNGHLLKIIYLRLLHRNLQEKWKFWASTTTQRRFRCCWLQLQASFSSRSPIFWTSMWWARKPQM